jgi:hypothetical protein
MRGKIAPGGRKNLPQRHQLPGLSPRSIPEKPVYYWAFRAGTTFADLFAMKVNAAMRLLSEI